MGHSARSILSPIFKNQSNSFCKILATILFCTALPVGARDLWAKRYVPFAVVLDYCCEFIMRAHLLPYQLFYIIPNP